MLFVSVLGRYVYRVFYSYLPIHHPFGSLYPICRSTIEESERHNGDHYVQLAEGGSQGPWQQTFVKGLGISISELAYGFAITTWKTRKLEE